MYHLLNQVRKYNNVIFEYRHTEYTYINQCRIDVFQCPEDFTENEKIWGADVKEMHNMLTLLNNIIDKCSNAIFGDDDDF